MSKRCCDDFDTNTFVCSKHSKVKMVVWWNDTMKTVKKADKLTLLSFVYLNSKPDKFIVNKMKGRLLLKFHNQYNCIEFYNRQTGNLIEKLLP